MSLAAFLGAFIGSCLIKKNTIRTVQIMVGTMLLLVVSGMSTGLFKRMGKRGW